MSHLVEEILRQAIERGEFQNLPGRGKRLDLEEYFSAPAERRAAYGLLKSNGFVPQEVELLKEIEALQEAMQQTDSDTARQQLQREIETRRLKYNLLMERWQQRRK